MSKDKEISKKAKETIKFTEKFIRETESDLAGVCA
jgi:hypothetical protein